MRQPGDVAQPQDEKYESNRAANARSHGVILSVD